MLKTAIDYRRVDFEVLKLNKISLDVFNNMKTELSNYHLSKMEKILKEIFCTFDKGLIDINTEQISLTTGIDEEKVKRYIMLLIEKGCIDVDILEMGEEITNEEIYNNIDVNDIND